MSDITDYDIEHFYDNLIVREVARQHQFRVTSISTGFGQDVPEGINDLENKLLVETATLPSRNINNVPVNFHGIDFNLPGNAKYSGSDAWNVKFRLDQQLNIRRIFEDWTTAIFDDRSTAGSIVRSNDAYIVLSLFDQMGTSHDQYVLWGVYPTAVGALEYNVGTDGDIVTCDVTLAYHYWSRQGTNAFDNRAIVADPSTGGGVQASANTYGGSANAETGI
tara:strand:- start:4582 stop:5244 length:663 start_codon:yes stop_codon:yes gene_type:complete